MKLFIFWYLQRNKIWYHKIFLRNLWRILIGRYPIKIPTPLWIFYEEHGPFSNVTIKRIVICSAQLVFKKKKGKATKSGMKFLFDINLFNEIADTAIPGFGFHRNHRTKPSTFNMADPDTLIKAKIHYFAREKYYHSMQVRPLLYALTFQQKKSCLPT